MQPVHCLINGKPAHTLSVLDRSVQYGDGCFETIRIHNGQLILGDPHIARLQRTCERLGIAIEFAVLQAEIERLLSLEPNGILKIIISRGAGGRGYRPSMQANPTRIVQIFPIQENLQHRQGIIAKLCKHRLAEQLDVAGLKHLNRLDQVLASVELHADDVEGICCDQRGNVIEGTRSNIILFHDQVALTPDLSRCGVRGVMLDYLLQRFTANGIHCEEKEISVEELLACDEWLVCNSVFGVWPVNKLHGHATVTQWSTGPLTQQALQYQDEIFPRA